MLESDVTEGMIEKELKLNDNRPYAQDRWEICKSCDKLTAVKFCRECSCFMPIKVRFSGNECPIGKWKKHIVVVNGKPLL
jgi:hypothetical protein